DLRAAVDVQCHGERRHRHFLGHGVADDAAGLARGFRGGDRLADAGVLRAFGGARSASRWLIVKSALDVAQAPLHAALPVLERELDAGHDAGLALAQALVEPIVGWDVSLGGRAPRDGLAAHGLVTYDRG